MKKYIHLLCCTCLFHSWVSAQQPPVGLQLQSADATPGYTLFSPLKNSSVYLVDNCGKVVNEWEFSDLANRTAYLQPDGRVVRTGTENIEIRSWDNALIWSYSASELEQHHDIEPLPNGNILVVAYDYYTLAEMQSAGRRPENTAEEFRLDKILEIKPIDQDEIEIVWEWRFYDHLVQDIDDTLPNFGDVPSTSGRLDINYDNGEDFNYTHVNSIDYNLALDQIIISSRNLNEVYIIDHSTTTEEARGSSGGQSGKGGDFLWRWGNPVVYQQGSLTDQRLFRQHDAKWVLADYTDEGSISIFNNHPDDFSSKKSHIELLAPALSGGQYTQQDGTFLPNAFSFSWSGTVLGDSVYQEKQSGVLFLENGNFLVCESGIGRIAEITRSGEVVWVYKNPAGSSIFQDGNIDFGANGIFRADRYAPNYLDFTPDVASRAIEDGNTLSENCNNTITAIGSTPYEVQPPFVLNGSRLELLETPEQLSIFSAAGQHVYEANLTMGTSGIQLDILPGVYILNFIKGSSLQSYRVLILTSN